MIERSSYLSISSSLPLSLLTHCDHSPSVEPSRCSQRSTNGENESRKANALSLSLPSPPLVFQKRLQVEIRNRRTTMSQVSSAADLTASLRRTSGTRPPPLASPLPPSPLPLSDTKCPLCEKTRVGRMFRYTLRGQPLRIRW